MVGGFSGTDRSRPSYSGTSRGRSTFCGTERGSSPYAFGKNISSPHSAGKHVRSPYAAAERSDRSPFDVGRGGRSFSDNRSPCKAVDVLRPTPAKELIR